MFQATLFAGRLCARWLLAAALASSAFAAQATDGEVRKIERAQARITLRHGPIAALDIPAMTLAYRVSQPAMLEGLNEGDAVSFEVERINGQFVLTSIHKRP